MCCKKQGGLEMPTKKNLTDLRVKELEQVCKQLGIPYYSKKKHLTKDEMIENIKATPGYEDVEIYDASELSNEQIEELKSDKEEVSEEVVKKEYVMSDEPLPDPESFTHTKNKEKYIENIQVGTLVAFLDDKGKPRTGAMVNISTKNKKLKLQTEFGWEFIVPWDKVLWVKQGNRWPNGIYRLLKEWKYKNAAVK